MNKNLYFLQIIWVAVAIISSACSQKYKLTGHKSTKNHVTFDSFMVNSKYCDRVSCMMALRTDFDSGRLSFESFNFVTKDWNSKSSISGRFGSKSFNITDGNYHLKYAVSWLLEDTGQLVRACFEDLRGTKKCTLPITVKGCDLLLKEPIVSLDNDSLHITFCQPWSGQTVYLNLITSSGETVFEDKISTLESCLYSNKLNLPVTDEKYRLVLLWKNKIYVKDI